MAKLGERSIELMTMDEADSGPGKENAILDWNIKESVRSRIARDFRDGWFGALIQIQYM